MTLPTSTRVTDPYETDGVQRDFEFDFPAFYNADTGHYGIEVRRLTALDYEVIDKSLYDIFLNDEDKSGYVRFHVAPMAGDDIYIAGDTTRSQQLNLINYGRYSAQSIEKAFDLIVALIQEFVSKVDEETRQRILSDQALRDFLLIKFNQFTAEVTTKIDKHIGDINGFMSSLIPMFVCIMRKEIANYAETQLDGIIDAKLSDLSTQVANSLDVLDESVSRINAATTATAIAARLFDTPAAGVHPVTGVPAGSYFNVRSPNAESYVDEYQNVGGSAVATGKRYLSALGVQQQEKPANTIKDASGKDQQEINSLLTSSKYIDVRLLGVIPNSTANQTVKINSADAIARSAGKGLYFPTGTYTAFGLLPTVSWVGDGIGKTIVKSVGGVNDTTGFCQLRNSSTPLVYSDIEFNANVNPDPTGSWANIFHSHFLGGASFSISNSSKVLFSRVKFSNSKFSGLRAEGSSSIVLLDCFVERARGHSGDGCYFNNCAQVYAQRLNVSDVTRIGIVFENNSKNCTVLDSIVEYAHHGSKDLGGGEYNAGFWAENSAHITWVRCRAINVEDVGFVNTNGATLLNETEARFNVIDCIVDTAKDGYWANSKTGSVKAIHKLHLCKTRNVAIAVVNDAKIQADSLQIDSCDFEFGAGDTLKAAFNLVSSHIGSVLPTVLITNTVIKHNGVVISDFKDTTKNSCDVFLSSGSNFNLTIDNLYNEDKATPIYIKDRATAVQHSLFSDVKINDCFVNIPVYFNSGNLRVTNSNTGGAITQASAGKFVLLGGVHNQQLALSGHVRFIDAEFVFDTAYLYIQSSTSSDEIRAKFSNCSFTKDVSTNNYSLRIQYEGATKPKVVLSGCEFISNSTVASDTNTHIWVVRSPSTVIYQNVLCDNFAPIVKVDTTIPTTPVGVTPLTLH